MVNANLRRTAHCNDERDEELRERVHELECFSYTVSHDLLAPLRCIEGFSAILLKQHGESMDAEALELLQRIDANARHMHELVHNLFRMARCDSNSLATRNVDLTSLILEIADRWRLNEPQRELEFHVAENLNAHGDPGLLRVVFENLLGNAIKYTRNATVAQIRVSIDCNVTNATVICVADNGVGFDPRHAERLFQPFERLHDGAEFEGFGIGLATAARIVRRHGGRIWAESELGEGARFYLALPDA